MGTVEVIKGQAFEPILVDGEWRAYVYEKFVNPKNRNAWVKLKVVRGSGDRRTGGLALWMGTTGKWWHGGRDTMALKSEAPEIHRKVGDLVWDMLAPERKAMRNQYREQQLVAKAEAAAAMPRVAPDQVPTVVYGEAAGFSGWRIEVGLSHATALVLDVFGPGGEQPEAGVFLDKWTGEVEWTLPEDAALARWLRQELMVRASEDLAWAL
jgi:hypothetical protein